MCGCGVHAPKSEKNAQRKRTSSPGGPAFRPHRLPARPPVRLFSFTRLVWRRERQRSWERERLQEGEPAKCLPCLRPGRGRGLGDRVQQERGRPDSPSPNTMRMPALSWSRDHPPAIAHRPPPKEISCRKIFLPETACRVGPVCKMCVCSSCLPPPALPCLLLACPTTAATTVVRPPSSPSLGGREERREACLGANTACRIVK